MDKQDADDLAQALERHCRELGDDSHFRVERLHTIREASGSYAVEIVWCQWSSAAGAWRQPFTWVQRDLVSPVTDEPAPDTDSLSADLVLVVLQEPSAPS